MSSLTVGAEIRYTLDGSDPTPQSTLYTKPLTITKSTTLKARAFKDGLDDTFVATVNFEQVVPRPAVLVKKQEPGLVCRYYEGAWDKLPDFEEQTLSRESIETSVDLPDYVVDDDYGVQMTGLINVPTTGLYTFHLYSDDGSLMTLGGQLLIDNDGLHGRASKVADIALAAGLHVISVEQFERGGDANLELWLEGPGLELQRVPAGMLFH